MPAAQHSNAQDGPDRSAKASRCAVPLLVAEVAEHARPEPVERPSPPSGRVAERSEAGGLFHAAARPQRPPGSALRTEPPPEDGEAEMSRRRAGNTSAAPL